MNHIKIYIILLIIGVTVATALGIYIIKKKNKLKDLVEFLVKSMEGYGKNLLNKVKLAVLLNTIRAYTLSKVSNPVIKFILELFWPEIDLLDTAFKIGVSDNKSEAISSIPDIIVSKTVDNILNNSKYTNKDFNTTTNLKITEKDREYLEGYIEGQVNKLEEARIGIKAGVKW